MAAAVLLESGHTGRVYELTGPAAVTPRERAAAIADALGEPHVEQLLGRPPHTFAGWAARNVAAFH